MTAAELKALIAGATNGALVISNGFVGSRNVKFAESADGGDGYRLKTDGDTELWVALHNNAERFAELLRREEAAVVASGATTEPVSDPYKLHWAWYGNDHVYLTAELEIVGVVHLPQSGNCIEYPWRCGSVVGTALCIGDARAAVEDAVRAGR